jgi:hypothetical protein
MSVENLQDELLQEVVYLSRKICEMRRDLANETNLGKLALGIKEVSRLEGVQEGIKVAKLAIRKHIGD